MEQVFKNSKLNKDDWLLIKNAKPTFKDANIDLIGILRAYDNKYSLSGCIKKFYKYFKISGTVKEFLDDDKSDCHKVFCWYKKGFIVLCDIDFKDNINGDNVNYVNIFKLDKKEIEQFCLFNAKLKMLEALKDVNKEEI